MKRVITASRINPKVEEAALGMEILVGQTWYRLIRDIYDNTEFYCDLDCSPSKFIYLFDTEGNEYEAEVTRYSDGQYELRVDNIHPTGLNRNN